MSARSITSLGVVLLCLGAVAMTVFFFSKNVRARDIAKLDKEVASLTERLEKLEGKSDTEAPTGDPQLKADVTAVSNDLAKLRARIRQPNYLLYTAFFSTFLLSYCGSIAVMMGIKRRRREQVAKERL